MKGTTSEIIKDKQYFKFSLYGFLKNLRFFQPFLIIFFLQNNLTYLEIGALYAIREISINVFEIPSGIVADAIGRKFTLSSSLLIYIISFIFFYFGDSFLIFIFAMLFYALGDAFRSGVNKALIINYLQRTGQLDHRVDYYGHTRSWSQLGSAVSSLLAGILVFFNENLSYIFLFSIVPYLVGFINVLLYPNYLDKQSNQNIKVKEKVINTYKTFAQTMKNIRLLRVLINASIYSGFYKSVKDFIQPFLKTSLVALPLLAFATDHQQLSVLIGLVYFFMFLGSAIASRNAEKVENIIKSRAIFLNKSLIAGALIGIITGVLIMKWVVPIIIITLFIVLLIIENLRKPSAVAEITIAGDKEVHASLFSVVSQLTSIFAATFVLAIGYFADHMNLGSGIVVTSLFILVTSFAIKIK